MGGPVRSRWTKGRHGKRQRICTLRHWLHFAHCTHFCRTWGRRGTRGCGFPTSTLSSCFASRTSLLRGSKQKGQKELPGAGCGMILSGVSSYSGECIRRGVLLRMRKSTRVACGQCGAVVEILSNFDCERAVGGPAPGEVRESAESSQNVILDCIVHNCIFLWTEWCQSRNLSAPPTRALTTSHVLLSA